MAHYLLIGFPCVFAKLHSWLPARCLLAFRLLLLRASSCIVPVGSQTCIQDAQLAFSSRVQHMT